jgi:hypothetical protein
VRGLLQPLSQGGDTGSNSVGAASPLLVRELYRAARFHAAHSSALLSTESLGKARGVADDIGRADLDVSIKKEWRHNRRASAATTLTAA